MILQHVSKWEFALFSANINQVMTDRSWKEHAVIFNKWKEYHGSADSRKLDCFHLQCHSLLTKGVPGILAMFHLGNHMHWPLLMAQEGVLFDVVLDKAVYDRNPELFDQLHRQMNKTNTYNYLFSEDPRLLFGIKRALATGKHILIFADGASGSVDSQKDQRFSIPFLEGNLNVKMGIPFISSAFNVPVYTLIDHKRRNSYYLDALKPITQKAKEDRFDFVLRTLDVMYHQLEIIVNKQPERWECWAYLHKNGMLDLDESIVDEALTNHPLLVLELDGEYCVFDRRYYTAQKVNLVPQQ
ncbi:hypothetical protein SAMN05660841_00891 [Sphingobacterium nematocida]|uniref:Lauroyl/myristoyl acyltransferase n=1 Tax=Sphingobacterium nematocida TaxID=1513896 RepID=A0A1T5BRZ7_9SPHI|nr:hypothetical protein [Sphingobacterium nematocida]SKB49703.1 hypothetical protein SAMN05660841_00891 [Sphingobacterium nematocida]